MTLQFIDCDQNSDEWYQARLGIPTASAFKDILAKGEGKMRKAYMMKLAGELITGEPASGQHKSADMERGHEMEAEARDAYTFATGAELIQVGFVTDGKVGCSPDRLIGDDGGLEIKTAFPHILAEHLLADRVPPEHIAQVQGSMWITDRKWWDVCIYWPRMPVFIKRVERDDGYIANLAGAVTQFRAELEEVVARLRSRARAA